jgi:hypothetical protein
LTADRCWLPQRPPRRCATCPCHRSCLLRSKSTVASLGSAAKTCCAARLAEPCCAATISTVRSGSPPLGRRSSPKTRRTTTCAVRSPAPLWPKACPSPRFPAGLAGGRASRPVGRVLCARVSGPTAIHLGLPLPAASCGLPASIGRATLNRSRRSRARRTRNPCDLAPGGVYRAARIAPGAGGLLHHRFTLAPAGPKPGRGGLFSVALSRGSPRVGVTDHPALRSPDLPHPAMALMTRRGRPAGSPAVAPTIPVRRALSGLAGRYAAAGPRCRSCAGPSRPWPGWRAGRRGCCALAGPRCR